MSRTRDLIDQIKQITIEIRDIKDRRKPKIDSSEELRTVNVRNHTLSGPLQEGHEEHDEDNVHYESNKHWGQGYPETSGNIEGTSQGLGQFYCTVTNRHIYGTFGMCC